MKIKSIGFFGGSFDPIHCGHLHLALSLLEKEGLDQVIFCPAFISPFKLDCKPHVHPSHREEMVKIAISPIPSFTYCDYEIKQDHPSYTIDTIKYLKEKFKSHSQDIQIRLILGDDMLKDFAKWKRADELLEMAPPLVGSRNLCVDVHHNLNERSKDLLKKGLTEISVLDISSTMLRNRLKKRLYCGHLIPHKVLEYIYQKQLYE